MAVSAADARRVGDALGVDWGVVSPETFRYALGVELEHRDVTHGDLATTGRIALAHLREAPDYYARLAPMEAAMEAYWAHRPKPSPTLGGAPAALATAALVAAALVLLAVLAVALARRRGAAPPARFCARYWGAHPPLTNALGYAVPAAGCPLRRGGHPGCAGASGCVAAGRGLGPGAAYCGGLGPASPPPFGLHDPHLARDPGAAAAFETDYCRLAPAFCSGFALEP